MVIMMLDHTRDFVHQAHYAGNPLDPATTHTALYLTRWITHLCAPAFVLLAGVAAGLQAQRNKSQGRSPAPVARFLLSRGAWLVALELTVVQFLISFTWNRLQIANLQVIWVIGVNMMLLAAMVWLPRVVVGTTGVIIIAAHNLLDHVQVPVWNVATDPTPSVAQMLWQVLHQTGFFPLDTPATTYLYAGYPLLPWTGILFAGYGLSAIFAWEPARRSRLLALAAAAMLALFLALRLTHGYGDPDEWNTWPTARQTVMDFFDVQKYGPSLQFTLVTLSPSLLLLAWAGTRELNAVLHRALITLGRVPLFFYLLQWIFAHVAGIVVTAAQGLDISPYFMNGNQLYYYTEQHGPPQIGGPLWLVYVCWIAGVSAIYPLCRWFARVKAERKDVAILRYL
jgi:uncharacterized membrane protein